MVDALTAQGKPPKMWQAFADSNRRDHRQKKYEWDWLG